MSDVPTDLLGKLKRKALGNPYATLKIIAIIGGVIGIIIFALWLYFKYIRKGEKKK